MASTYWSEFSTALPQHSRCKSRWCVWRVWERWASSVSGKDSTREVLLFSVTASWERIEKMRPNASQKSAEEWWEATAQQQYKKFSFCAKKLFILRMVKHQDGPRENVKSPSLEIVKFDYAQSCAACYNWTFSELLVGLHGPLEVSSTLLASVILFWTHLTTTKECMCLCQCSVRLSTEGWYWLWFWKSETSA